MSFLILLVIVLSAFNSEFFGFKIVYLLLPLTFIFPGTKIVLTRRYYFIFPLMALLIYGFVLRDISNLETSSSVRYGINILILALFSQNVYLFVTRMSQRELRLLFARFGYAFIILLLIEVFTFFLFGQSIFIVFDITPESYSLGQLLTTEPNWLSYYLVFVMLIASRILRFSSIKPLVMATLFQLILNPSRIAIASIIGGIVQSPLRTFYIILFSSFILFILANSGLLPYTWTEDLGSNIERNPRIFDFLFINQQIMGLQEKFIGSGFGNISHYTESMTWRENYFFSNQLWLQVYVNFGLLGIFLMIFWMIRVLKSSPKKSRRLKLLLFILLQLHNAFMQPSFWVLLALIFALDDKLEGRTNV